MGWLPRLRPKTPDRTEIVKQVLNQNKIREGSTVDDVTLEPGTVNGEGTYVISVTANFSRANLRNLGLTEGEGADFTAEAVLPQMIHEFRVKQKPLEYALTRNYGTKFPAQGQAL